MEQSTTFYFALQNSKCLDLRDKRGKIHKMSFVLLGFFIGLMRNRDGCLSSIHRSMVSTHDALIKAIGIEKQSVISRSHLPIFLEKVNGEEFERLMFEFNCPKLSNIERSWFSCDGKELRGSILDGDTRGECVVQVVSHENRQTICQDYYSGLKESEIVCVRNLLQKNKLESQKISLDALHLCPATTALIEKSKGTYLIGLKGNQEELLENVEAYTRKYRHVYQHITNEKGHGRVEKRVYRSYDIREEYQEARWSKSNLSTVIWVERTRYMTKSKKSTVEVSYYISNQAVASKDGVDSIELFHATRNHWSVERSNYIRDVTLKEDQLRTKKRHFITLCKIQNYDNQSITTKQG